MAAAEPDASCPPGFISLKHIKQPYVAPAAAAAPAPAKRIAWPGGQIKTSDKQAKVHSFLKRLHSEGKELTEAQLGK